VLQVDGSAITDSTRTKHDRQQLTKITKLRVAVNWNQRGTAITPTIIAKRSIIYAYIKLTVHDWRV